MEAVALISALLRTRRVDRRGEWITASDPRRMPNVMTDRLRTLRVAIVTLPSKIIEDCPPP